MTISTTQTAITYAGDGVTTAFAVPFVFFGSDELLVIEKTIATGAEVTKTLTTHYTVAGGDGATGTVTAVAAPSAAVLWVIKRNTKRTQLVDYVSNDPFPADTHERALDRIVAGEQEIAGELDRAAKLSAASTVILLPLPDPVAGKFLRANSTNDGYELADITSAGSLGLPVSVANGGTGGATAATARSNLGALAKAGDSLTGLLEGAQGADIASAGTVDVNAATGNVIRVSGTTNVNSFGNPDDGTEIVVQFTGACPVTHQYGGAQPIVLLSAPGSNVAETMVANTVRTFTKISGTWYETGGVDTSAAADLFLWSTLT